MTPKTPTLVNEAPKADWIAYRERGSITLLRIMAFLSLRLICASRSAGPQARATAFVKACALRARFTIASF
jgi:hypothetical protein